MQESPAKSRLSISTGTIIRFFMVVILILVLYRISDILLVVVAATIFASAIEPVIRRLKREAVAE